MKEKVQAPALQVGSKVWVGSGDQWEQVTIYDENRTSWFFRPGDKLWARPVKFPKRRPTKGRWLLCKTGWGNSGWDRRQVVASAEELRLTLYAYQHRNRIGNLVCCLEDGAKLEQIAAIVDYKPQ